MKSFCVTRTTACGQVIEDHIRADSYECTIDRRLLLHTATAFGKVTEWYPADEWILIKGEEPQL